VIAKLSHPAAYNKHEKQCYDWSMLYCV